MLLKIQFVSNRSGLCSKNRSSFSLKRKTPSKEEKQKKEMERGRGPCGAPPIKPKALK